MWWTRWGDAAVTHTTAKGRLILLGYFVIAVKYASSWILIDILVPAATHHNSTPFHPLRRADVCPDDWAREKYPESGEPVNSARNDPFVWTNSGSWSLNATQSRSLFYGLISIILLEMSHVHALLYP